MRYCANAGYHACNWLLDADSDSDLCRACALNRTIPDLRVEGNLLRWRKLELAKHRLIYSLLRFRLPLRSQHEDPERGLAFDFLADPHPDFREEAAVMTGHADGVITINIAEADDAERERQRLTMAEPYRTLLGHFRHEVGHYYWSALVGDHADVLTAFREQFGDERQDYAQALQQHYSAGVGDWQPLYVSAYASAHPWEDWAETWAHYLHIVDVLETAYVYGVSIQPRKGPPDLAAQADFNAYRMADFDALIQAWLPLTYAMNSLNRSMGQPDLYPFVLPPPVMQKLHFVHDLIWAQSS